MTLFFFFYSFALLARVCEGQATATLVSLSFFLSFVSTAYVDKIVFQELGIPELVSLVVK